MGDRIGHTVLCGLFACLEEQCLMLKAREM
nr:MAG TPA: hypothetical protein [Caudoviricetes sp.]